MAFLDWLKIIFLGIVEGVTEWLPISSTGHLILVDALWKTENHPVLTDTFMNMFEVVIQFGAIIAVIVLFWQKLWPFHTKAKRKQRSWFREASDNRVVCSIQRFCDNHCYMDKIVMWLKIAISCLPAILVGLPLDDWMEEHLYNPPVVAAMLILYGVAFILVDYMTPGPRHYEFWNVVGQLGMFSNLYSDPNHVIWPGPYWYFGLMVQLYAVYRFILFPGGGSLLGKVSQRYHTPILLALLFITLFGQLAFDPEGTALEWYRYNLFGSLPVFIAGLLFARHFEMKECTYTSYLLLTGIAAILSIMLSMWFSTWIFVPFFICIGALGFVKCMPEMVLHRLSWVGSISAAMFVCHPVTRKVIIPISRHGEIFAGLLLYIVATIVLAMIFRKILASIKQ